MIADFGVIGNLRFVGLGIPDPVGGLPLIGYVGAVVIGCFNVGGVFVGWNLVTYLVIVYRLGI